MTKRALRERFEKRVEAAGDPGPPCDFCGRLFLAGWCCYAAKENGGTRKPTMSVENGVVTGFDPSRGIASIRLDAGETTSVHAAGVHGGRAARFPKAGDRVCMDVRRDGAAAPVVLTARLTSAGKDSA